MIEVGEADGHGHADSGDLGDGSWSLRSVLRGRSLVVRVVTRSVCLSVYVCEGVYGFEIVGNLVYTRNSAENN